jgi:hypothetical protein
VVREKVRVEIPRQSIKPGGFVAIYIDDKFDIALSPDTPETSTKPFVFVWDTKADDVADGPHNIRALLYNPAEGDNVAVTEGGDSSVNITVANKIKNGPSDLRLRYKFREGQSLDYTQDGKAVIVGGISENGASDDQELATTLAKQQFAVQDVGADVSLVRNRTTSMKVTEGGQEYTLGTTDMASSIYQEVDPLGAVHYEDGSNAEIAQFNQLGISVSSTLELPELPREAVTVGSEWIIGGQRIPLPGSEPGKEPKVTLKNKLVDLEWQNGYPTAKIHQTYTGALSQASVQVAGIEITTPTVTFERDIYVAYNSGKLVRSTSNLSVAGMTTSLPSTPAAGAPGMQGGGMPGMMGGGGKFGGMMGGAPGGAPGMPGGGRFGGMQGGGMPGMPGRGFSGAPGGGMPGGGFGGGMPGMPGGGRFGGMQGGGMPGGGRFGGMQGGGMPGMPGGGRFQGRGGMPPGMTGSSMPGGMPGGMPGMMGSGNPGMMGMMGPGRNGVGTNIGEPKKVTVRTTTTTELIGGS